MAVFRLSVLVGKLELDKVGKTVLVNDDFGHEVVEIFLNGFCQRVEELIGRVMYGFDKIVTWIKKVITS